MKDNLEKELLFNSENNIYSKIKEDSKHHNLYIWGVGGVAPGVVAELKRNGIKYNGFFVDVNNYHKDTRIDENETIYFLDDLINSGEEFSVIVGHSRYELINEIKKHKSIKNVWTLPMVTRQDISMNKNFIIDNMSDFQYTFDRLADDRSRVNMVNYLNSQIAQDETPIIDSFTGATDFFGAGILKLNHNESYLDCGAYDGSSIDLFINKVKKYNKILALEVIKEEYKKLKEKFINAQNISIINIGVSDHDGVDRFIFSDQSTTLAKDMAGGELVDVYTLDSICEMYNFEPTLIKICIGGTSIVPILNGANNTLKGCPKLVLSAGIDKRALIDYIKTIEKAIGTNAYNYYLRFMNANSARLMMYAIPNDKMKTR